MITGHYSKTLPLLKKHIQKIMKKGNFTNIYVGATYDTAERFKKYASWEYKQAIYKTSSTNVAKAVEKELIVYCKNNFPSCNISNDSKGLKMGESEYFVYILADNSCQVRK